MVYRILKYTISNIPPQHGGKTIVPEFETLPTNEFVYDYAQAQGIAEDWCGKASGRVAIVVCDRGTYKSGVQVDYTPGPGEK